MIFRHVRNSASSFGGATIAIEEFKPWILQTLNPGEFFDKKIGIAICCKQDRFNKKIGRELAESRVTSQRLTVQTVLKELDKTTVTMLDSSSNSYVFVKYAKANSIFFTAFNFKD